MSYSAFNQITEKTKKLYNKISKLNHFSRSGLVASGISFVLILTFFFIGLPPELVSSECIIRIFSTAALISHLFSNATYIAGTIDLYQNPRPDNRLEFWLTSIGIVSGLTLGIVLSLTLLPITFFSFFSTTTVVTGALSGLGSRIGGLVSPRRHNFEKLCLVGAGLGGCSMGIFLTLTSTPIMHISGVITFVTCASPLMTSIIFIFLVTSLCMSGADYFSKSTLYLCNGYQPDRHHEYEGSFFGSILSVAAILFFVTHLHLLATATFAVEGTKLAVATTIALFAKCFGIDGICSRIGRTLDRLFDVDDTIAIKTAKIALVITGVAALFVIIDMGCKLIHSFYPDNSKKPIPLPTPKPQTTPSLLVLTTEAKNSLSPAPQPLSSPPVSCFHLLRYLYVKLVENKGQMNNEIIVSSSPQKRLTL